MDHGTVAVVYQWPDDRADCPLLLILTGKTFGISSSFRHINAMCMPRTKIRYFRDYDWRSWSWQLIFVLGIVIGDL